MRNQRTFLIGLVGLFITSCGGGHYRDATDPTITGNETINSCSSEGTWESLPSTASINLAGRDQVAIFWTGKDYLVYGGVQWGTRDYIYCDGKDTLYPDGAKFNPATKTWTKISQVNAPNWICRWDASYSYGEDKLFMWGGNGAENGPLTTGGMYDTTSDSWEATNTINAPEDRAYHTINYYNAQFFVWGGRRNRSDFAPLNTGAVYHTVTKKWRNLSTLNAPEGVSYFASASSGSKLFVWGGAIFTPDFNTDGTPKFTVDGKRVSVQGWDNIVDVTNKGAMYNYAYDRWETITSVGAPEARRSPVGLWTGSKFIVWGGTGRNNSDTQFNDGGIYDPITDSWKMMPTEGAPSPRSAPYVTWTGKYMIIWGGTSYVAGTRLNDGAIFDPQSNKWISKISNLGAPSIRSTSATGSQLWNGTSMFLWSGYNEAFKPLNDTFMYAPQCN